jgi:hypothetical protein
VAGDCLGRSLNISVISEHSNEHLNSINIIMNLFFFSLERTPFHRVKLSVQQMPSHKSVTVVLGVNAILAATENGLFAICGGKSDTGPGFFLRTSVLSC